MEQSSSFIYPRRGAASSRFPAVAEPSPKGMALLQQENERGETTNFDIKIN
jgi:hypothetical protein